MNCLKIVALRNFKLRRGDYITRIKTLVHIHYGDTRATFSVHNRPLHRSCSAIGGKERDVQIHTAVLREIKHRLRQNFAVRNYCDKLGIVFRKKRHKGVVLKSFRSKGRYIIFFRKHLNGSGSHNVTASSRLVLTRYDGNHLVSVLYELAKAGHRDFGRAHKHYSHNYFFPFGGLTCTSV